MSERTEGCAGSPFPAFLFQGLFFSLDLRPDAIHRVWRSRRLIPEDMGMAADHFRRDAFHHVAKGERSCLLGHARVVDDLKQQIAQFLLQIDEVAPSDGVGNLVGFFQRVGCDGLESAPGPRGNLCLACAARP